jgi:hypothetical protein
MDFATAALQNGINTYKISIHKKINIIQKMKLKFLFLYFSNLFIIEAATPENKALYDTFVKLCKQHFVMQPLQNPLL